MTDIEEPGSWTEILREYQEKKPALERLALRLRTKISALATQVDLDPLIISRVRSIDEFSDLVSLCRTEEGPPATPLLCLIEIGVHTRDQVPILVRVLEKNLNLESAENTIIVGGHEASRRFIVRLDDRKGADPED